VIIIEPLTPVIMNRLVDPQTLIFNSKGRVAGFNEFLSEVNVPQWELLQIASEVESEWRWDWPEGQGFGSSDMTYMMKHFIDRVITQNGKAGYYMTAFTPSLSVVEYSEAKHHNRVQRMESGN
jgi:hypothetical protein